MPLEIVTFPGGPVQTNAYLVADGETGDALVIDAPYETTAAIVAEAAKRGWTIGQIVITHTHWDHVADAAALTTAIDAPLRAHPLAVERLASPEPFFDPPVPVPPVETTSTLDDGDTVTLGSYTFRVMHLPGHDSSHIALIDETSTMFLGGDVLFPGGHGRTDLPGTDQAVMNRSLRRLVAELPGEITVYPGHGVTTTIGAEAGKRHKNVTRTFFNTGQIAIPNNGIAAPYPVPIQVGGFKKGKIKDIEVVLRDFSHTTPDHVDILLVAPGGRNALLMSDAGGNDQADNLTLTFDDQAVSALPLTSQLVSGTFRPTNDNMIDNLPAPAPVTGSIVALSVFNCSNPNGQWQLFVRDDTAPENGEIAGGWSLEITAQVKKKKHR